MPKSRGRHPLFTALYDFVPIGIVFLRFFYRFTIESKICTDLIFPQKSVHLIYPFCTFAAKVTRFASTEQLTTEQLKTNKHVHKLSRVSEEGIGSD